MLGQRPQSSLREHLEENIDSFISFLFFPPKWDLFSSPTNCFSEGSIPFSLKAGISGLPPSKGEIRGTRASINHEPELSHQNFHISSQQALSQKLLWDFLPFLAFLTGQGLSLCLFKVKSTDLTVQNSVFPTGKYFPERDSRTSTPKS